MAKSYERKKALRTVVQVAILAAVLLCLIRLFIPGKRFQPVTEKAEGTESSFIALSYLGVALDGENTLISRDRLKGHLTALKKSGYETISQKELLKLLEEGGKLPKKALFLMFEDGRTDTAVFAGKILKSLNYKATMLTYGGNITGKDKKFLRAADAKRLYKNSFFEAGTGGYRLAYINVGDKGGGYYPLLTQKEMNSISEEKVLSYNHYLMDYIRDEYDIPMEDYEELKERISFDYHELERVYKDTLNTMPSLYALMHANTGRFGTNENASQINEEYIKTLFKINFNREGKCLNRSEASAYDLTRMMPAPYWYTNHLLMKVWEETGEKLAFAYGDKAQLASWKELAGQPEFKENEIILTSLPGKSGILLLKDKSLQNERVQAELKGNRIGTQSIFLRAEEGLETYIQVSISNDQLIVAEKEKNQETRELGRKDLKSYRSEAYEELGEDYEKNLSLPGSSRISIWAEGSTIKVIVNGRDAFSYDALKVTEPGYTGLLSCGAKEEEYAAIDSVYDGVFKDLFIQEEQEGGREAIIFDNRLHGTEKWYFYLKEGAVKIMHWFIKNL